jgi:hypothetical protein
MKGKLFSCPTKDFEQEVEKFFVENKNINIKFINTGMGWGGEGVMVVIFYEPKARRLDE